MKSYLQQFLNCFTPLDLQKPIELASVTHNDFTIDLVIKNGYASSSSNTLLKSMLGGLEFKFTQEESKQQIILHVSKALIPAFGYRLYDIIANIENNFDRGLFLGVGSFGPEYLSFNDFTHGMIIGASGYGKSNFFSFLLSQTLAFHPHIVNHVIDPKGIDFKHYEKHPGIGLIATAMSQRNTLITHLLIEMKYREEVFSKSFVVPPVNLQEYQILRQKFERYDLPDFKRTILWIDEANFLNNYDFGRRQYKEFCAILQEISRRGRASGIHMMLSTQVFRDVDSDIRFNIDSYFSFFTNSSASNPEEIPQHSLAIKGRFIAKTPKHKVYLQAPLVLQDESLGLAYSKTHKERHENRGFTKLSFQIPPQKLSTIITPLISGAPLSALEHLINEPRPFQDENDHLRCDDWIIHNFPDDLLKKNGEEQKNEKKSYCVEKQELPDISQVMLAVLDEIEAESKVGTNGLLEQQKKEEKNRKINIVKMPDIVSTNNTFDISGITEEYKTKRSQQTGDLSLFIQDLSENRALIELLKDFYSTESAKSFKTISPECLALPDYIQRKIQTYKEEVLAAIRRQNKSPLLIITGQAGLGKKSIAHSLLTEIGVDYRSATTNDLSNLGKIEDEPIKEMLKKSEKGQGAENHEEQENNKEVKTEALIFHDIESAIKFNRHCEPTKISILITSDVDNSFFNDLTFITEPYHHIHLDDKTYLSEEIAASLIKKILQNFKYKSDFEPVNVRQWAEQGIIITPYSIHKIVERASRIALYRAVDFDSLVMNEVLRSISNHSLISSDKVKATNPLRTFDDLFVHHETKRDLEDIVHKIKNKNNNNYKFKDKLRPSNRTVALFAGEPGTGKSFAAEVIAKEAGLNLWSCDIAKMQSAYVGQTEAIMSDIFRTAETAKVVLLIDEADAFLSSRDSMGQHYDKKIVNHLLNLIENFQGILILTTNNPHAFDSALSRRCDIKTLFRSPDKETQAKILMNMLQPDAPLADNIDFIALFECIDLTGGLIRNAVERSIIKMERKGETTLTFETLREGLIETYDENILIKEERRKIGLLK